MDPSSNNKRVGNSGFGLAQSYFPEKESQKIKLLNQLRAFELAVCQTIRSLEEDRMELKEIGNQPFSPILLEKYMEGVKNQLDLVCGTIPDENLEPQICEVMVGDPFLSAGSQIQPYDGNPSISFARWSQKFEDILSLFPSRLSEQQKIASLKFCLEGQARAELDLIEPKSLVEAIAHLKSKFENDNTKSIARQKLSSCRQMPGEKIFEFANRLNEVVRSALIGEEENAIRKRLLEEFMDRILPDLQYEVKAQRPNEYSKAYEIAQQYELLAYLKRPSYADAQVAELNERVEALAVHNGRNVNNARGKCFNCGWGPPCQEANPAEIAEALSSTGIQRQPRNRRRDRFEPMDFRHDSWQPMDTSQENWLNERWGL